MMLSLIIEREDCTKECRPRVVAVRRERSEVHTRSIEGQHYSVQVQESEVLVRSLLYGTRAKLFYFEPAFVNKNARLMTVSVETVLMEKYRPGKNQSHCLDLPT